MSGEIERALYAALTGWPYLSELSGDRVFPLVIPNDAALPAVAYQKTSGARLLGHCGPTGHATARIQVTIQAEQYSEAKEIAAGIRDLLFGFRGTLGGVCEVFSCALESEVDGYGPQIEAPTVRLDLVFYHRE